MKEILLPPESSKTNGTGVEGGVWEEGGRGMCHKRTSLINSHQSVVI